MSEYQIFDHLTIAKFENHFNIYGLVYVERLDDFIGVHLGCADTQARALETLEVVKKNLLDQGAEMRLDGGPAELLFVRAQ